MNTKPLRLIATALLAVFIVNVILLFQIGGEPAATGAVEVFIIKAPGCDDCFDPALYLPEFEALDVPLGEAKVYEYKDASRKIKKYELTKLPAMVLSEELSQYPLITDAWDRVGTIAKDGSYILAGSPPPFYDLEEERVRGVIDLMYLSDVSCTGCYDVTGHKSILARFGMAIGEELTIDIASPEGAALLAEHGLTQVPTVILTGEASLYPGFDDVWTSVGRSDGETHIFTNLGALGLPYKDLSTGELITPQES
ncbi:hypothetical protein GOV07_04965 [Candidatus Woesearchaeota archaeon]|nr:hypothetical protein [Candidatus Woesearchaeota archaeon]